MGYFGLGWLVSVYLSAWQDLARGLANRVVDAVTLPYVLGHVR